MRTNSLKFKMWVRTPINLGGFTFEGVTYQFPKGETEIMPGARWVIASGLNLAAFAQRYPQVQVAGAFSGTLSNGGEPLILRDEAGNVVTMVEYDDENGWATAADGTGQSLELIDAHGEAGAVSNWKAQWDNGRFAWECKQFGEHTCGAPE